MSTIFKVCAIHTVLTEQPAGKEKHHRRKISQTLTGTPLPLLA